MKVTREWESTSVSENGRQPFMFLSNQLLLDIIVIVISFNLQKLVNFALKLNKLILQRYSSILRNAKYNHKTEEPYSLLLECKHHIIHFTIQRYLFLLIHIYPQSQEMLAQKIITLHISRQQILICTFSAGVHQFWTGNIFKLDTWIYSRVKSSALVLH